ncbi:MAG: carboxylating nicotinate-nucleotide diphosphorylase [Rickettsiales bacterium]|nr:carboxylating nicotinate-nucleotide diphosphorylase [Rickettsiales bacterium]
MIDTHVRHIIKNALSEDIGTGDITSQLTIPAETQAQAQLVAREAMVVCGMQVAEEVYHQLDISIRVKPSAIDGQLVTAGDVLAEISGPARALLTGERVMLNLMQRMSGVATLTREYVEKVQGTKAIVLDTRKTMPGLRAIDKYAVYIGGGKNHRMRLDDMVLIKDNHIALCGGIYEAVVKVRASTQLPIVVECDTIDQVKEALIAQPDRILLDNMSLENLKEAVRLAKGKLPLEASGGITLATIHGIAHTGVDFISVGALTHSTMSADIGLDVVTK